MTINSISLARVMPTSGAVKTTDQQLESAQELKKAYTDFVGKTFFGQMMKAMRSTVGKPAYFDGGQAEEAFGAQLDQQMADAMSGASAAQIADPLFERQFPQQAKLLRNADSKTNASIGDLAGLRRR